MTVATTNITAGPYTGNGLVDEYDYDFKILSKSQLIVYETDTAGVRTTLTVDTDYTVSGVGETAGGTVTRVAGVLPADYTWYIRSNYQATQDTAFASQGGFFPRVHEAAMDKLTFLVQQLKDQLTRSFRFDDGYSGSATTQLEDPIPSAYIRWNSTGTALINGEVAAELYLGAKASDPTTDNEGNALIEGATYFNSVTKIIRIYDGVGWQNAAAIATTVSLSQISDLTANDLAAAVNSTGAGNLVFSSGAKLVDPVLTLGGDEGTVGQVPFSQGPGLPPAYGDLPTIVPPGMVLLHTVTTSAAATCDIETGFTSTYDHYVLKISGLIPASDQVINARLKIGGSYLSGATAYLYNVEITNSSDSSGTYGSSNSGAGQAQIALTASMGSTQTPGQLTIEFANPDVSGKHCLSWRGTIIDGAGRPSKTNGAAINTTAGVLTGIRLFAASGNLSCVARLYGIRGG